MNPEVKAKWLAALRSGEYKQGREYLRKNDSFCCLGVLCDIAVKEGIISEQHPAGNNAVATYGVFGISTSVEGWTTSETSLPDAVKLWGDFPDHSPEVNYAAYEDEEPRSMELAVLNDDERLTFAQIADLVEEQL